MGGWVLSGGGASLPCRPGRQTPAVIPAREKASLRDLETTSGIHHGDTEARRTTDGGVTAGLLRLAFRVTDNTEARNATEVTEDTEHGNGQGLGNDSRGGR